MFQAQSAKLKLNFGNTDVLQVIKKRVLITNLSPVTSHFHAFMRKKDSCFRADPYFGEIHPGDTAAVSITACLNDAMKINDTLHVVVENGALTSELVFVERLFIAFVE